MIAPTFWDDLRSPRWLISVAFCSVVFSIIAAYVVRWLDRVGARISKRIRSRVEARALAAEAARSAEAERMASSELAMIEGVVSSYAILILAVVAACAMVVNVSIAATFAVLSLLVPTWYPTVIVGGIFLLISMLALLSFVFLLRHTAIRDDGAFSRAQLLLLQRETETSSTTAKEPDEERP